MMRQITEFTVWLFCVSAGISIVAVFVGMVSIFFSDISNRRG